MHQRSSPYGRRSEVRACLQWMLLPETRGPDSLLYHEIRNLLDVDTDNGHLRALDRILEYFEETIVNECSNAVHKVLRRAGTRVDPMSIEVRHHLRRALDAINRERPSEQAFSTLIGK
jgi:hypothetical protein